MIKINCFTFKCSSISGLLIKVKFTSILPFTEVHHHSQSHSLKWKFNCEFDKIQDIYHCDLLLDENVVWYSCYFFNFSEKGDFCFIKYFLFELFVSVEFISLMFYFLFLRSCQLVSHMSTKTLDKSQSRKTLIFLEFMGRHLRHLKAGFSFFEIFFSVRHDEN